MWGKSQHSPISGGAVGLGCTWSANLAATTASSLSSGRSAGLTSARVFQFLREGKRTSRCPKLDLG